MVVDEDLHQVATTKAVHCAVAAFLQYGQIADAAVALPARNVVYRTDGDFGAPRRPAFLAPCGLPSAPPGHQRSPHPPNAGDQPVSIGSAGASIGRH